MTNMRELDALAKEGAIRAGKVFAELEAALKELQPSGESGWSRPLIRPEEEAALYAIISTVTKRALLRSIGNESSRLMVALSREIGANYDSLSDATARLNP